MSTSIQILIMAILFFCLTVVALIVFFITGKIDALFIAIGFVSGAVCMLAIRANLWNKKKILELEPNVYFWIVFLFLVVLECFCIYLFYFSDKNSILFKIDYFAQRGKYLILLIPIWIVTLYNLKK